LLPLRPIAMLAEEVAWLDARHPGRVGVGVAPGALDLDFDAMEVPKDEAIPRFRTGLARLVAMLSGRELGVLEHDRALSALAGRPIPVLSTAMSPPAARRAAAGGAGLLFDGATPAERHRPVTDAYLGAGGTGPRVLIRRVWLGDPPADAFARQDEVYRTYSPAAAQQHWRDDGWLATNDPDELVAALLTAADASGADSLNLRVHAPGITPAAARQQIRALGTSVTPKLRAGLAAKPV
jgi:alkanesulfonate monooxygenase SsuD/methylene tetrahydromethanopterin reductase-like flavin-dependent oxidoreductase (luciferase family)